ncbi:MAG: hypothetical protein WD229_06315, partial [Pirellulales bacterium]
MTKPSRDPSIEQEPHLQNQQFEADSSEALAEARLRREAGHPAGDDAVEHTVWDESVLSSELAGAPADDQVTYARWLAQKMAETSATK